MSSMSNIDEYFEYSTFPDGGVDLREVIKRHCGKNDGRAQEGDGRGVKVQRIKEWEKRKVKELEEKGQGGTLDEV